MLPEKNVGGTDRKVRAALGLLLAVGAVLALRSDRRPVGAIAGITAAGLLFNAVTCFCGLNATLGIDTARGEE